jgi:hypothetical protein
MHVEKPQNSHPEKFSTLAVGCCQMATCRFSAAREFLFEETHFHYLYKE